MGCLFEGRGRLDRGNRDLGSQCKKWKETKQRQKTMGGRKENWSKNSSKKQREREREREREIDRKKMCWGGESRTSTQSKICSSLTMSSSRRRSRCWLSSSGERGFLDSSGGGLRLSGSVNCSFWWEERTEKERERERERESGWYKDNRMQQKGAIKERKKHK